jgi:hypothetical protein
MRLGGPVGGDICGTTVAPAVANGAKIRLLSPANGYRIGRRAALQETFHEN